MSSTTTRSFSSLWKEDRGEMPAFVGNGILPRGGFFLFGGETGIGKSMLMLNIMHALFDHRPRGFPGCRSLPLVDTPERVLYLDAEVGEWGLWRRVKDIWDEPPPHGFVYATATSEYVLDTEPGRRKMLDLLQASQPEIVIIDPVSSFLLGDDSENSSVAQFFRSLRWFQEQLNPLLTFFLIHHFRKKPSERADFDGLDIDNFRGASKWNNEAWTALTLIEEDRATRRIRGRWAKVRHGPKPRADVLFRYDERNRVTEIKRSGVFTPLG